MTKILRALPLNAGLFLLFFSSLTSFAQVSFNYSSLLLYRVGDGSTTISAAATQISVLEYTTTGSLLQTINMPTTGPDRLTASGNQTTQGKLRYNGRFLAVPGFDAAVGTANVASTTTAAVPRRVTVLENDLAGTAQTANLGTSTYNANSIRGAIPQADGSGFWTVGQGSNTASRGIWYHDLNTSTNNQINNVDQSRSLTIHNAQLYVGRNSGGAVFQQVGTGLPTSAAINTNLPNAPFGRSFVFADVAGGTVIYATNDNTTIRKYSLVGGNWIFDGVSPASGAGNFLDLTAMVDSSGNVQIFAVTGTRLLTFTDTSGFNSPWSAGGWSTLATAGTNYAFRGITHVPEPSHSTLLAVFLALLVIQKRQRIFSILNPPRLLICSLEGKN